MTDSADSSAADIQTLFDSLLAKHGPLSRWSALDIEIAGIASRMMYGLRTADPSDAPKIGATVMQLISTLPTPLGDAEDDYDLKRLPDEDLRELERITAKARDKAAPLWVCPEPEAERPMGECEREAVKLGRYLDTLDCAADHSRKTSASTS